MKMILLTDLSQIAEWSIKFLTAALSIVGTVLGIYNFRHARRREEIERANEDRDWQMYIALRAEIDKSGGGNAYTPYEGSDEHRWAERMVSKGLLKRGLGGLYYTLASGS